MTTHPAPHLCNFDVVWSLSQRCVHWAHLRILPIHSPGPPAIKPASRQGSQREGPSLTPTIGAIERFCREIIMDALTNIEVPYSEEMNDNDLSKLLASIGTKIAEAIDRHAHPGTVAKATDAPPAPTQSKGGLETWQIILGVAVSVVTMVAHFGERRHTSFPMNSQRPLRSQSRTSQNWAINPWWNAKRLSVHSSRCRCPHGG
jgi:hypothetical protein